MSHVYIWRRAFPTEGRANANTWGSVPRMVGAEGMSRQRVQNKIKRLFFSGYPDFTSFRCLLFRLLHLVASYSCFIDEVSSLLFLKDYLMALQFLLSALSLASFKFTFFCLFSWFALLYHRLSWNIWIFIHIEEWGTKMLTGSCVNSGNKARSWFFIWGIIPNYQCLTCLFLWTTQFPQKNA